MSACSEWEERLVELLYDDGNDPAGAAARAHLAECGGCRRELEGMSEMRTLMGAWPNAANVPRMVYVNQRHGWFDTLGDRIREFVPGSSGRLLRPVAAALVVALALVGFASLIDLGVAEDGTVRIGRFAASEPSAAVGEESRPVTRVELREALASVVGDLEATLEARGDEERRLTLAAIDERMREQGLAVNDDLRVAFDQAFAEVQRQHEADLGLIFSAIDEMGVITSSELQRINAFLGALAMPGPGN